MFKNLYKNVLKLNSVKMQTKTVKKIVKEDIKSGKTGKQVKPGTVNNPYEKNPNKKILIQPEPKKYNDMPLL